MVCSDVVHIRSVKEFLDLFPAWKQTLFFWLYEGKIISGRERQEKGERPVNIFHVAAGRENSCGVEMVFNVKATKATQIMSEHHWSCTSVSKGWIPPALSPTRGACVGLVVPVIYHSYKTVGSSDSPGHSGESRRCGGELVSGFGWSWLLGVAMFPDAHFQSNPWHTDFVEGRTALCLKLPAQGKCNEFSARNCMWTKMEPELGICPCGGPLHWHRALCASPEGCHPTETCHFRAGRGIWHHKTSREKHRGKFSFSGQENQGMCLLCSTSRKSIAEGFLLGDLCFMKFMPGAEDWGAGKDSAVFLPSAALIVCNDLISSTSLPCSKHRHVAFYYLY